MSINFDGNAGEVNAAGKTGVSKEQMMKKLSKKQQAQLEIVFNKFDKSKDGTLNETEMNEVYEYFNSLDKSGDGKITKKELQAGFEALTKKEKRAGADMYELFFKQLAKELEPPKEEKQTRAEKRIERKAEKEAAKNAPSEAEVQRQRMLKNLTKDFELPKVELKTQELKTIDMSEFTNANNVHKTSFGEILDNIIKSRYGVTNQKDIAAIRARIKDLNNIPKDAADIPKAIKMPDKLAVGEKEYTFTTGKVNVSHEGFYYQKKENIEGQDGQSVMKRYNDKKEEIGGTRYTGNDKALDYTLSKDNDGKVVTEYKDAKGAKIEPQINADKKVGTFETGGQKFYFEIGEKGEHKPISEAKYNQVITPPATGSDSTQVQTPPAQTPTTGSDSTQVQTPPAQTPPATGSDSTQVQTPPAQTPPTTGSDSTQVQTPPAQTAPTTGLPEGVTQEKRTNGVGAEYTADIKDGKVIKETYYEEDGKVIFSSGYEYDAKGNNTKKIHYDKDGKVEWSVDFKYDAKGNNTKTISYNKDGKVDGSIDYEYDAKGNKTKEINYDKDGKVDGSIDYEYDAKGNNTKSIVYDKDGKVIFSSGYEYDAKGNKTKQIVYDKKGKADYAYEYDAKGNTTKKTIYDKDGKVDYSEDHVLRGRLDEANDFDISKSEHRQLADEIFQSDDHELMQKVLGKKVDKEFFETIKDKITGPKFNGSLEILAKSNGDNSDIANGLLDIAPKNADVMRELAGRTNDPAVQKRIFDSVPQADISRRNEVYKAIANNMKGNDEQKAEMLNNLRNLDNRNVNLIIADKLEAAGSGIHVVRKGETFTGVIKSMLIDKYELKDKELDEKTNQYLDFAASKLTPILKENMVKGPSDINKIRPGDIIEFGKLNLPDKLDDTATTSEQFKLWLNRTF